jgi:hypothetical protein
MNKIPETRVGGSAIRMYMKDGVGSYTDGGGHSGGGHSSGGHSDCGLSDGGHSSGGEEAPQ